MKTVFSYRSQGLWPTVIAIPLLLLLLYNCIQIYHKYKKYDVVVAGKQIGTDNQKIVYHQGTKYSLSYFLSPSEEREQSIVLGLLCICGVIFCLIRIYRFFSKKQIIVANDYITYFSFFLLGRIYIPTDKIVSIDAQHDPHTNDITHIALKAGRKIHNFHVSSFDSETDFRAFIHAIEKIKDRPLIF